MVASVAGLGIPVLAGMVTNLHTTLTYHKRWRQPTQKVCLMCRPLYPLIFVSNQPSLRRLATTSDKFQSP